MDEPAGIRVLAVDDHPLIRAGVGAVIGGEPGMELVAEGASGEEAVELFRRHRPDVVLMDLGMPGMGGVEAIRAIVAEFPDARLVALTTFDGDEDIHRALAVGARGYVLKDMLRGELPDVIRSVAAGRRAIPPDVAGRLAEHAPRVALTRRELEVLGLMADGMSNPQIGRALVRSEETVKVHVRHILEKLGTDDRTAAVTIALQRGILHLD
ncbi:MAG TPA: response regulator transcription factor [Longimicrobiaceae bacterium]|jgi:DNA-binding NarL/FixJ family response regulator